MTRHETRLLGRFHPLVKLRIARTWCCACLDSKWLCDDALYLPLFISVIVLSFVVECACEAFTRLASALGRPTLAAWRMHRALLIRILFDHYYRTTVVDPHRVLQRGIPLVFASSHAGGCLDRAAIQYANGRHPCRTISVESGAYCREVELNASIHIPTSRQRRGQMAADAGERGVWDSTALLQRQLAEAANSVAQGGRLWIAPEGGISESPWMGKLHSGVARIAQLAAERGADGGVLVVPTCIMYESRHSVRSAVLIEFGSPLLVERADDAKGVEAMARRRATELVVTLTARLMPMLDIGVPPAASPGLDRHLPESIDAAWLETRAVDVCCQLVGASTSSWLSRVRAIREVVGALRRDVEHAWRRGFDRICLAFTRFRFAFESATGEAALRDTVSTAFGCGQHIKLHAHLHRSRRLIDALRNFRTSVAGWRYQLASRRYSQLVATASQALDELGCLASAWLASLIP
uniref:Phospholipid/glycerol acyltransferase domain-containing protein n=1 Tax=Coccolithus braarudii TaxID=221442 RepID=A0A7S0LUP4_9EUKA|mmetsp:Transcript_6736/g.14683  ORF Transcript_6736/g.14683 Transcript_6736/m.14683 type:complete len:467 (+) Transcript_6736:52-1452(+)